MDLDFLQGFISRYRHVVLSTSSLQGVSESAVVGVVVLPDCSLLFDTKPSSRKYVNLAANPKASFVFGGWDGAVTAQYEGLATELAGDELTKYKPLYLEAFPDGKKREEEGDITWFIVRPTWARLSDFTAKPPAVQERRF